MDWEVNMHATPMTPMTLLALLLAAPAFAEIPLNIDQDGDGYPAVVQDCDDSDPNTWPGAPELCDGKDTNCDGAVPSWEVDADGDGFMICEGDCEDHDPDVYPDQIDECDGIDNDCDGWIDLHWTLPDGVSDLASDGGGDVLVANGWAGVVPLDDGFGEQLWLDTYDPGPVAVADNGPSPVSGFSSALLGQARFDARQPFCMAAEFTANGTDFQGLTLGVLDAGRVDSSLNWATEAGAGGPALGALLLGGNLFQSGPLGVLMRLDSMDRGGAGQEPYGGAGVSVVAPDGYNFVGIESLWVDDSGSNSDVPFETSGAWLNPVEAPPPCEEEPADDDPCEEDRPLPQVNQVVFGWNADGEGSAVIDALVDLASDGRGPVQTTRWVEDPTAGTAERYRIALTSGRYDSWAAIGLTELHMTCLPCPDDLAYPALPKRPPHVEVLDPDRVDWKALHGD